MIRTETLLSGAGTMQTFAIIRWNEHSIYGYICMLLVWLYLNIMCWDLFKDILIDTVAITSIVEFYGGGYVDTMKTFRKNTEISGVCGIWYVYGKCAIIKT